MKWKSILVVSTIICSYLLFFIQPVESQNIQPNNGLIIQSYSRDYIWTENAHHAIVDELNARFHELNVFVEYMDTKNYMSNELIDNLYKLYKGKYKENEFDFIIAGDNNALEFLLMYRDELFPNTPVIAYGISNVDGITLQDDFYILEEKPDYKATIDIAIDQNREAENLYFIFDKTTTSLSVEKELEEVLEDYRETYNIAYIDNCDTKEGEELIASLSEKDILFYGLFFIDSEGNNYSYNEMPEKICKIANVPVYAFWDFYLGTGIIGGKVFSFTNYDTIIVDTVSNVLNGENIPQVKYITGHESAYIFDHIVADQFGIDNFPSSTRFINKPMSFYDTYKEVIWVIVGIISILVFIIIVLIHLLRDKIEIERKNTEIIKLNSEMINTQREIITTLGDVIETKSEGTFNHVQRVAKVSAFIAREYGMPEDNIEMIELIAPMHDVGKIGISEDILKKPGKLTDEEFDNIKFHTTIGHEILKSTDNKVFQLAAIIAHQHHEKWDGTGYPSKLSGEEIHIYARIISIADVYDALRSVRPYKGSWDVDRVVEYIGNNAGIMFDPKLAEIFVENIEQLEIIRFKYVDKESTISDMILT